MLRRAMMAASGVAYTTLNPADKAASIVLTNGNLAAQVTSGSQGFVRSVAPIIGKRYFEVRFDVVGGSGATCAAGVAASTAPIASSLGGTPDSWGFWGPSAGGYNNNVLKIAGTAASGDVFSFLVDADAGTLSIGKNGAMLNGGAPIWNNLSGTLYAAAGPWSFGSKVTMRFDPAHWDYPGLASGHSPILA